MARWLGITAPLLLAAVWPALPACADQSTAAETREQTISRELKSAEDPTLLERRAWLETEWNKFKEGSSGIEETLGGLTSWRVSSNQDWAVRIKLPYAWHVAGSTAGASDLNGLGDIALATGSAVRLGESWRVGGGVELRMPSGTEHDLSDNVWRLQEFAAVGWDATRNLTLSPSIEHNESLAEELGASPVHFLEMFVPATVGLPQRWSATAKYEAKVDFQDDRTWTHSAKLAIAKELERVPLSFTLSIEKPFDHGEKTVQLDFKVTCFFRSKVPSSLARVARP